MVATALWGRGAGGVPGHGPLSVVLMDGLVRWGRAERGARGGRWPFRCGRTAGS